MLLHLNYIQLLVSTESVKPVNIDWCELLAMAFAGLYTLDSYIPQWAGQWFAAVEPNFESTLKPLVTTPLSCLSSPLHHPYSYLTATLFMYSTYIYTYVFIIFLINLSLDSHHNVMNLPYKRLIFTCFSVFCTWQKPLWLKRHTTEIPLYLCYLSVHYHFWWPLPLPVQSPPLPLLSEWPPGM